MFYLMRHGQDDENYIGGWSDVNLIESGRDEVYKTALWIKKNLRINRIVCSSIKRAVESAKIVSEVLGIPYMICEDFKEQNKGLLNGLDKNIAKVKFADYVGDDVGIDTVYPDGESLRDLYNRVKNNFSKFLSIDDNVLVITHRGVINMFYYILNNIPLDMDKKRFGVVTASVHMVDKKNMLIKKVR